MSLSPAHQNFLFLISKLLTTDNTERKNAETQIQNLINSNYSDVITSCSEFLKNDSIQTEVRHYSSIIINLCLKSNENQQKYLSLPKEIREIIKNNILFCLSSEKKEIRKASATSVSSIAKIEIPIHQWEQLMQILCNATNHINNNFKLASLMTIGYICDECSPDFFSPDEKINMTNSIINVINNNMNCDNNNESIELILQCFDTLNSFLPFLKGKIDEGEFRKKFFGIIFYFIESCNNKKIKIAALELLNEIPKVHYLILNDVIDNITKMLSNKILNCDDEEIGIQGYIFFISLSKEELKRENLNQTNYNFSQKIINLIWPCIQNTLLNRNINYEKLHPDDYTRYSTISFLLDNLSKLIDFSFINDVFYFMGKCLNSNEIKEKNCAIYAFTSILETKWNENLRNIIPSSLPQILSMIDSNDTELEITCSWCIEKLCLLFYDIIAVTENSFQIVILKIIEKLKSRNKKVIIHLCLAIHNLSSNLSNVHFANRYFSKYLKELLMILLTLAYDKDAYNFNLNISKHAFLAIGTLIEGSQEIDINTLKEFFPIVYDALKNSLNNQNFINNQMQYDFQSYICSIIIPTPLKMNMTKEQINSLYNLIKSSFDDRKGVYEEGLMAIAALSINNKDNFDILNDFMIYLKFALQNYKETEICHKAIFSLGELILNLEEKMNKYLDEIMPLILEILTKDCDKSLKVQSLMIFTDIFYCEKINSFKYFDIIINYVTKAFDVALLSCDPNDIDLCEYYKLLRERIIECVECIISAIVKNNKKDIFQNYIDCTIQFINNYMNIKDDPNEYTVSECCGILCDLFQLYGNSIGGSIQNNTVVRMKNIMEKTGDSNKIELAKNVVTYVMMYNLNNPNF